MHYHNILFSSMDKNRGLVISKVVECPYVISNSVKPLNCTSLIDEVTLMGSMRKYFLDILHCLKYTNPNFHMAAVARFG